MQYLGLATDEHMEITWAHPMHAIEIDGWVYVQAIKGMCDESASTYAVSAQDIQKAIIENTIKVNGKFFYIQ